MILFVCCLMMRRTEEDEIRQLVLNARDNLVHLKMSGAAFRLVADSAAIVIPEPDSDCALVRTGYVVGV